MADGGKRGNGRGAKLGKRDPQTVLSGGTPFRPPAIEGVAITEIGNIMTRSGWMAEVFRADWPGHDIQVLQVNYVALNPLGVTDWHCHQLQNDRLIGVSGAIKLALYDSRPNSRTKGATDIIRFGAVRPLLVAIPRGVWHALRNEGEGQAAYLNVADQAYQHAKPDNWRADATALPDIL